MTKLDSLEDSVKAVFPNNSSDNDIELLVNALKVANLEAYNYNFD
jgi:hypothetical protein